MNELEAKKYNFTAHLRLVYPNTENAKQQYVSSILIRTPDKNFKKYIAKRSDLHFVTCLRKHIKNILRRANNLGDHQDC